MSNYGTLHGRTNALPIVIGITVVLSMLPARWLGWTSDLADLVRIPVTPVSHIGMMFTNWIRPSAELPDLPSDEKARNDLLNSERDHYRKLYHDYRLDADKSKKKLRDYKQLHRQLPNKERDSKYPPLLLEVDLTGIMSSDVSGIVELKLVKNASSSIRKDDLAIVGRDIVGRISRVGLASIQLQPITHKDVGLINAAVFPSKPPKGSDPPPYHKVLLETNGDGNFYTTVPVTNDIKVNDLVVLNDITWEYGEGLILGSVVKIADYNEAIYTPFIESDDSVDVGRVKEIALVLGEVCVVTPLDEAPLRRRLTIAPRRRVRDVPHVVVLGTGKAQTK